MHIHMRFRLSLCSLWVQMFHSGFSLNTANEREKKEISEKINLTNVNEITFSQIPLCVSPSLLPNFFTWFLPGSTLLNLVSHFSFHYFINPSSRTLFSGQERLIYNSIVLNFLEPESNSFGATTVSNLRPDSSVFWLHTIFAILYCVLMVIVLRHFTNLFEYESKDNSTKTIMITNVPKTVTADLITQHFR